MYVAINIIIVYYHYCCVCYPDVYHNENRKGGKRRYGGIVHRHCPESKLDKSVLLCLIDGIGMTPAYYYHNGVTLTFQCRA